MSPRGARAFPQHHPGSEIAVLAGNRIWDAVTPHHDRVWVFGHGELVVLSVDPEDQVHSLELLGSTTSASGNETEISTVA